MLLPWQHELRDSRGSLTFYLAAHFLLQHRAVGMEGEGVLEWFLPRSFQQDHGCLCKHQPPQLSVLLPPFLVVLTKVPMGPEPAILRAFLKHGLIYYPASKAKLSLSQALAPTLSSQLYLRNRASPLSRQRRRPSLPWMSRSQGRSSAASGLGLRHLSSLLPFRTRAPKFQEGPELPSKVILTSLLCCWVWDGDTAATSEPQPQKDCAPLQCVSSFTSS